MECHTSGICFQQDTPNEVGRIVVFRGQLCTAVHDNRVLILVVQYSFFFEFAKLVAYVLLNRIEPSPV